MENKKVDTSEEEIERKFRIRLILIIVIGLVIISSLWLWNYNKAFEGEFGDKFGIVNSLFSGLAFAGIIITIYMQKHELELQRRELKATREVFDKQSKIMTDQQNDNTFFNLLSNHRQLVNSFTQGEIDYDLIGKSISKGHWKPYTKVVSGYDVLKQIAKSWKKYFEVYSNSYKDKLITNLNLQEYPTVESLTNSEAVTHTFTRELLHIHKFINQKFETDLERRFYRETLSNSLTDQERFIFEAMYQLFPNQREGIEYTPSYFLGHNYIDFSAARLPEFHIEYKYDTTTPDKFKFYIKFYANLIQSKFIVYENITNSTLKIIEKIDVTIHPILESRHGVISFLECLSKSKYANWENQKALYLNEKHFAIHLKLEMGGQEFSLLFGIKYDLSERFHHAQKPLAELTNVDVQIISQDLAKEIISLSHDGESL